MPTQDTEFRLLDSSGQVVGRWHLTARDYPTLSFHRDGHTAALRFGPDGLEITGGDGSPILARGATEADLQRLVATAVAEAVAEQLTRAVTASKAAADQAARSAVDQLRRELAEVEQARSDEHSEAVADAHRRAKHLEARLAQQIDQHLAAAEQRLASTVRDILDPQGERRREAAHSI